MKWIIPNEQPQSPGWEPQLLLWASFFTRITTLEGWVGGVLLPHILIDVGTMLAALTNRTKNR